MISVSDFGSGFHWGVASAAYQTEGAWNQDGKGASIWDVFSATPGKVWQNQNGRTACDFYNRYLQDLILLSYMGVPNFRFSISWPRVLPTGEGKPNRAGLDFYDRLTDTCLELGIEPWVTLYHWDLPQALEQQGGWTNRRMLDWFTHYTETCVRRLSDRVKNWMVLNEPLTFTGAGYFLGMHAPGKRGLSHFLPAAHHAALCQALGGRIIRSLCPGARVGSTFALLPFDAATATTRDMGAAQRMDALVNRFFLEPLLGKGYPLASLKALQPIERHIRDGDEALLAFDMDFIGVQNYTREVVHYSSFVPYLNARQLKASQRGVHHTAMDWEVYPEGMYRILKQVAAYPEVRNIMVTENGASFPDIITAGQVHDPGRIAYLEQYLAEVLKARREGVPVNGYFVWSFTDNFEWAEGFKQRFGLVYIDYTTKRRTLKTSGHWLRNFLAGATTAMQWQEQPQNRA